jgi:hypothetical protein
MAQRVALLIMDVGCTVFDGKHAEHAMGQAQVSESMVQGHLHKMLGGWLQEHTDIRDRFVKRSGLDMAFCRQIVQDLQVVVDRIDHDHPIPKVSDRKLARLAKQAAIAAAQDEQTRESAGLSALENGTSCHGQANGSTGNPGTLQSHALDGSVGNVGEGGSIDAGWQHGSNDSRVHSAKRARVHDEHVTV